MPVWATNLRVIEVKTTVTVGHIMLFSPIFTVAQQNGVPVAATGGMFDYLILLGTDYDFQYRRGYASSFFFSYPALCSSNAKRFTLSWRRPDAKNASLV